VTGEGLRATENGLPEELGFDLVAASLRSSSSDLSTFVEVLGNKLELALPRQTRIERRAGRVFSRKRRVSRIELAFGDERYVLAVEGGAIEPSCAKAVRGVVLKREPLSLEAWIEGVARGLAAEAAASEESRVALERLLRG
jgi:hypothetical protein